MRSSEPTHLNALERRALLNLARTSIEHGLIHGRPPAVDLSHYSPHLQVRSPAFVTLKKGGQLRGCIGHLEAVQSLVEDVVDNAFAASFRDPRFPPLERRELDAVTIEISVLTPPEPLPFGSEEELLLAIEPGRDGLILEDGAARGTFLPTVWESLPEPRDFLRHLKTKAGLRQDHWSRTLEVSRYRTESFSETQARG